ncbi:reverse transcriptase [Tanacetum coccineum]
MYSTPLPLYVFHKGDVTKGLVNETSPHISLNALYGLNYFQTIIIKGIVGKKVLHILVGCGSTRNFLDVTSVKKLGCKLRSTSPLQVFIANGQEMMSSYECKQFQLSLHGETFTIDVMLLPSGGCEMVLGIQWLATLGDINCNFQNLTMEFWYTKRRMVLKGTKHTTIHWMQGKSAVKDGQIRQAELSFMVLCVYPDQLWQIELGKVVYNEVEAVLTKYDSVFEMPTRLPPQISHDHTMLLMPNIHLINVRPYRHPRNQKDAIEVMVKELLESRVIRPGQSPFSSLIVMVKKKDGTWRMCVDYGQLNNHTMKDKFPIPVIGELIDELSGRAVFSKLGLSFGYHRIRMNKNGICKTAFRTFDGHYKSLGMPFDLTNAPSTFQSIMNTMFKPYLRKYAMVFFDDILVYSKIVEEHCDHLSYAEVEKTCQYEAVKGFLGLIGYYRRFVKSYAMINQILTTLLKKNYVTWNDAAELAFHKLKTTMMEAPVLSLFDFSQEFVVEIDALETGIRVVLCQNGHPLAYLSKTFSSKHQAMSTYEKEFLVGHFEEKGKNYGRSNYGTQEKLITYYHSEAIRGHSGIHKHDLSAYPILLQPLLIPEKFWLEISMDFTKKFPMSHGKSVIMVVVDRLSKYAHFMSLSHPFSASQVAQVFLDGVYKFDGLPNSIVSDRDKVFLSQFWKSMFSKLNVKLKLSTAYHPQIDGQTEVVNRCLGCDLRCMCGEKPKDWVKWPPLPVFLYNTNFHTTTKSTPYEIVYCQSHPIHIPYVLGDSIVESVMTLDTREGAINMMKFHLKRAYNKMKSQVDKHMSDK